MQNYLFAIDSEKEEVIVSISPEKSNSIEFIKRIPRAQHEAFYCAAIALTAISRMEPLDIKAFKAQDKVCQLLVVNLL